MNNIYDKSINSNWKIWTLYLFISCIFITPLTLSSQEIDYSFHAKFIYRFTKYINWPTEKSSGEFVIGVMGTSLIYEELVKITYQKKVGEQDIKIMKYSADMDPKSFNIIFIPQWQSGYLENVAAKLNESPVLIITDKSSGLKKVSDINFTIIDDKLRFEINQTNIQKKSMQVAGELISMASMVN